MFGYELNISWKLMTLFIKMEVILNTTQDGSVHDALQKCYKNDPIEGVENCIWLLMCFMYRP